MKYTEKCDTFTSTPWKHARTRIRYAVSVPLLRSVVVQLPRY